MVRSRQGVLRSRRHDDLVARLRRPAVEMIDDDTPAHAPALTKQEARVFAELLARYGRQFRGTARDRIVAYFEAHGLVDEELRRLESRQGWRRAGAAFTLGD